MTDKPDPPGEDETDQALDALQRQIEALREQARIALAQALAMRNGDQKD